MTEARGCIINSRLGNVTVSLFFWAGCPAIDNTKTKSQWAVDTVRKVLGDTLNNALLEYYFVAAFACLSSPYLPVFSSNTHACKHKYIHHICSILHTLNLNVLKCVLDYLIKCCGIKVKKELNYGTSHPK